MRRLSLSPVVLIVVAVLTLVPTVFAQMPSPFSADMTMTPGKGGEGPMNGKIYFGTQKFRLDMNGRGREMEMITDMTKKVTYMVMPQEKMYMELSHNNPMMGRRQRPEWKAYDASNPCADQQGVTCKKVGTEMVNGRMCDKWEFTKNGSLESTVWIDQKNHIPIRSVHSDGTTMELKNIQEGPQAASLFEIPAGYQKMDMGGMMGGQGMRPPQ